MTKIDLTGKRSGRLTVLYPLERRGKHGHVLWFCACDCGGEKITTTSSLNNKSTKSCGCLKRDFMEQQRIDRANRRTTGPRLYLRDRDKIYLLRYLTDRSLQDLVAEPSQARTIQTEFHCLQQ